MCTELDAEYFFLNCLITGPWSSSIPSSPYLENVTYSLTVPSTLTDYDTTDTSLWVAIWMGVQPNSDDYNSAALVQPILNWCNDQEDCGCPAAADEWCFTTTMYYESGQEGSAYVAVATGSILDFAIYVSGDSIVQTVSQDGEILSQRSDDVFYPGVFYGANECSSTPACGTLPSYTWSNITMTFSEAVTDLGTYIEGLNSTWTTPVSTQDGKVWTWDGITIEAQATGTWTS
ncbi:hypothetical protein BD289DRAFT_442108 [Coniella lustricola]|uniref:Concanavalin A-like lectin/glucanase domain-containing protein n=1 Tax=Coniella lustricola TaxID=2025994 RepID=A0A2T2ZYJ7_9PEZI|nr:hypothetical protein BD289DRAFT_442108 [Coniella lustricola]